MLVLQSNNNNKDLQCLVEAEAVTGEVGKQQHLRLWKILDEKTTSEIAKVRKQQHLKF